jgi:uncharacterized protein
VRHKRLRPVLNAFAYPGYFLRLPMRSLAARPSHVLPWNRWALLSFHDTDHGDGRGASHGGALAWLDATLAQAGVHDANGEAWLHCYPRVLGHTFKPVSFWHCHRSDGSLRAILVEVNNTFGERHCYLLDKPSYGRTQRADKVFHVSPFCAVAGHYEFRFLHAKGNNQLAARCVARIDLLDEHGPLIQTSLSGKLFEIDRHNLRVAFWRHPVLTWGVVARIHWQAAKLWWKRVAFHTKPEPPVNPVSR